jgi:tetratricopeptide (TPR) repeat protein
MNPRSAAPLLARVLANVLRAAMLLAAMLVGCTYYVSRGSDLYSQGRYIEAAQVLEQTEARLAEADPDERAEYGLYRGATLLRLGDLDGALHWLEYAQTWEQRHPGALRADELELLEERFIAVREDLERRAAAEGQVLQSRFR